MQKSSQFIKRLLLLRFLSSVYAYRESDGLSAVTVFPALTLLSYVTLFAPFVHQLNFLRGLFSFLCCHQESQNLEKYICICTTLAVTGLHTPNHQLNENNTPCVSVGIGVSSSGQLSEMFSMSRMSCRLLNIISFFEHANIFQKPATKLNKVHLPLCESWKLGSVGGPEPSGVLGPIKLFVSENKHHRTLTVIPSSQSSPKQLYVTRVNTIENVIKAYHPLVHLVP